MRENQAMGIIMPGKNRPLLGALLDRRTVGAIPFGGRYRLCLLYTSPSPRD